MSWFVAIAEHSRQIQAVTLLGEMDFLAYAPRFIKTIVKNGKKCDVNRFLFGNYFFVAMRDGWEEAQFVRGVNRVLLGPELRPLMIRDEIVDEIKLREIDGVIRVNQGLCRGQKVTPRVGYLMGEEGRFLRADKQRDVALFDILGVSTLVNFAPGVLEVLEPIEKTDKKKRKRRRRWSSRDAQEHVSPCLGAAEHTMASH
jgi:transcription antitermination factor NusG